MKRVVWAAMVIAAIWSPALAQTGMDLHRQCGNALTAGFLNRNYWHGYITGVVNGLAVGGSRSVCLSSGVTGTQAVMIVQNYMREHPEQLNESAHVVIQRAISEAFPCATILNPLAAQETPSRTTGEVPARLVATGTIFLGVLAIALMVAILAGAIALAKAAVRAARR
jgi:fructose-specific phosphotransferase system IIC component